jgi:hypothetical protein
MFSKSVNIGDICRWLNVDENGPFELWSAPANPIFNSKIRRFWIGCIARDAVKHGAIGDGVFQNEANFGSRMVVLGHWLLEGRRRV